MKRWLMLLALAGCAETQIWERPGATQQETARQIARCEFESARATAGIIDALPRSMAENRVFGACMRADGYARVR